MILHIMRSLLWKLDLGLWTYGLISLLGQNSPKLILDPILLKKNDVLAVFHILFSKSHILWNIVGKTKKKNYTSEIDQISWKN